MKVRNREFLLGGINHIGMFGKNLGEEEGNGGG